MNTLTIILLIIWVLIAIAFFTYKRSQNIFRNNELYESDLKEFLNLILCLTWPLIVVWFFFLKGIDVIIDKYLTLK